MSREDRFQRVVREAENVAGIGDDARLFPREQHVAVFGDLVLALLGAHQIVRVDVLQPDEDALDARARAFLDEVRNAVAERIDLDDEGDLDAFGSRARWISRSRIDLPILVAGEIVVGDEEAVQPLRHIGAHDLLDIVGRAAARFAPLHIDDGAEGALIGTAAARIEAGDAARRAHDAVGDENGNGRAFDAGQIVHEIVERLERAVRRVEQHFVEAAFGFAREERKAHGLGLDRGRRPCRPACEIVPET